MKNFNNLTEMLMKCPYYRGVFILSKDDKYVTVYNAHTNRVSSKNIKKNSKGEFINCSTPTLNSHRTSTRLYLTSFNTIYTYPEIPFDSYRAVSKTKTLDYFFDKKLREVHVVVKTTSYPWKHGEFRSFRQESYTLNIKGSTKYVFSNARFELINSEGDVARYKLEYDLLIEVK
ncbi:hypothetical protein BPT24_031 [Tenacibaculum phage pT24]|uniref:Uncharacterized protein n=1 Tax=Tenacibaculum phage pT24 TaxID=1880590 RepID=A0A1B4XWF9_9CAUD|nr:hypothetical protein HYP10_gp031 [Tenacibaculum phage pT24]BAV39153.1 hypothetical protein BPT24_031 [Tenacibaculum phage pT24]